MRPFHRVADDVYDTLCNVYSVRAVRRRTGGRRRRWVVLWPAAAAASAASDRMREHWNSALAKQAFFSGFTGVSHFTCDLRWAAGAEELTVHTAYACCARFHSGNEWIVHCLISGGSYKCSVQCWEDAESAGVENTVLENAGLENVGIKNMASVEWLN